MQKLCNTYITQHQINDYSSSDGESDDEEWVKPKVKSNEFVHNNYN